jgi:hypothetical protein
VVRDLDSRIVFKIRCGGSIDSVFRSRFPFGRYFDSNTSSTLFSKSLAVLSKLENLEKHEINFNRFSESHLMAQHPCQPNIEHKKLLRVRTLRMKPFNPYLWDMCLNVSSLSTTGYLRQHLSLSPLLLESPTYVHSMRHIFGDFGKLRHLSIDGGERDCVFLSSKWLPSLHNSHFQQCLCSSQISLDSRHSWRFYI